MGRGRYLGVDWRAACLGCGISEMKAVCDR